MIDIHQITAEPLLVAPHAAMAFAAGAASARKPEEFDHSLDVAAVFGAPVSASEEKTFAFDPTAGVAFIPVRGTLLNRFSGAYSSVTGYQAITAQVAAAAADPQVRAVVFDVDSFGGEAAGCFECAADVRSTLRAAGKPSVAVVNSNAYSAGYAMAAAADRVVLLPSGGAGSIGVVTMHADFSGALAQGGVKVTYIHAGDHKVDGNPYQPLPDAVRSDIQARINDRYDAFVAHVAAMRALPEQAVRDTQARCYGANDALALGLIDAISTAPEAYSAFVASLPERSSGAITLEATVPDIDQAAVAGAERARIKAILTGAEAAGRTDLAHKLAFDTDMAAEVATGILASAPRAAAPAAAAPADPLAAAMAKVGTPGIGADDSDEPQDEASAAVARLLAFQRKK